MLSVTRTVTRPVKSFFPGSLTKYLKFLTYKLFIFILFLTSKEKPKA